MWIKGEMKMNAETETPIFQHNHSEDLLHKRAFIHAKEIRALSHLNPVLTKEQAMIFPFKGCFPVKLY